MHRRHHFISPLKPASEVSSVFVELPLRAKGGKVHLVSISCYAMLLVPSSHHPLIQTICEPRPWPHGGTLTFYTDLYIAMQTETRLISHQGRSSDSSHPGTHT